MAVRSQEWPGNSAQLLSGLLQMFRIAVKVRKTVTEICDIFVIKIKLDPFYRFIAPAAAFASTE